MRTVPLPDAAAAASAPGSAGIRAKNREVVGDKFRFTVLADGLVRYEWAPDGCFEDRPSAFALHRNDSSSSSEGGADFEVRTTGDGWLEITTARLRLTYNRAEFSAHGLYALVFGHTRSLWRYGDAASNDAGNLGGTARTLDGVDGRVADWGTGVASRKGFAAVDDSRSMLLDADGFPAPRRPGAGAGRVDGYLFGYGHDYAAAVRALYAVSGAPPLLPRWALGNWWSRYHAYSAASYLALMDEFAARGVPLAVAVLDMDWHLTAETDERVAEAGQTGWTGYTWNRRLFPDPPAFVRELHARGLRVTLNEHPADGVHSYEEQYAAFARAVAGPGERRRPFEFDITDRRYAAAYFDVLLRPLEERDGCDFWWVDWQQGEHSRLPGVDPLWALNHLHFGHIDDGRRHPGQRPLILSRYAGPGSHRYPVGFSGDAVASWASLRFQPAFTATAANVGYGWWSHDVGGHMGGGRDGELTARWVQLGCFSPILRLHSTRSDWVAKEPWRLPAGPPREAATAFLRLRHRLLPYLHAMNARAAARGEPLVRPVYWEHPGRDEAYAHENSYLFGTGLLVLPITDPADPALGLARTRGWLPPGGWVDFFTGTAYAGDRELWVSRPLELYPVFVRAGAIVPLDGAPQPVNGAANPEALEVVVALGADGYFELPEEPAETATPARAPQTKPCDWHKTCFEYVHGSGTLAFWSAPPSLPSASHLPPHVKTRNYTFRFPGYRPTNLQDVRVQRMECEHKGPGVAHAGSPERADIRNEASGLVVRMSNIDLEASYFAIFLSATSPPAPKPTGNDALSLIKPILHEAQIEYALKEAVWGALTAAVGPDARPPTVLEQLRRLEAIDMGEGLRLAVTELLMADDGL